MPGKVNSKAKKQLSAAVTDRKVVYRLCVIIKALRDEEPPMAWDGPASKWRCNCTCFAKALGCSERTILRDIEILKDLGFALEFVHSDRTYYCSNASGMTALPLLNVSDEEVTALLNCLALGGAILDRANRESLHSFLVKLEYQLPDGFIYSPVNVASTFTYHGEHVTLEQQDTFAILQRAILDERCVRCRYFSPYTEEEADYFLEPLHLACLSGVWYLIARKRSEQQPTNDQQPRREQLFRLNRFRAVERVADLISGRMHPADVTTNLDPEFGTWLSADPPQSVRLKIPSNLVPFMREISWKAEDPLTIGPDDFWFLDFKAHNLDQVASFVLKWAPDIEALDPPELRERITFHCRRLLQVHEQEPPPQASSVKKKQRK